MHRAVGRSLRASHGTLLAPYERTLLNLHIGSKTRVIFQGFTGKQATADAKDSIAWGTNVVGGVTPGRSDTHLGLPVLPNVRLAVKQLKPDATAIYVAAQHAAGAIEEAIEAEVPLIVAVAEHIPVHDMLRIHSILNTQSRSRLLGPNSPGITSVVGKCRIGFHPLPCFSPGRIGIAAKSGTLSYEAIASTTRAGLGQSLCIGVGGDIVPGTSLVEALSVLICDENTEAIALIGEIGGEDEIQVAEMIKRYLAVADSPKPIVGLIAGVTEPPAHRYYPSSKCPVSEFAGRVMGHAGAFTIYGQQPNANDKISALRSAGVTMINHPGQFGDVLKMRLEEPSKSQTGLGGSYRWQAMQSDPRTEQHRRMHTSHRPLLARNSSSGISTPHHQQVRLLTVPSGAALSFLQERHIVCGPFEGIGWDKFLAITMDRTTRAPCILASRGSWTLPWERVKPIPIPFPSPPSIKDLEDDIVPAICESLEITPIFSPTSEPITVQGMIAYNNLKKSLVAVLHILTTLFYQHEGIFLSVNFSEYATPEVPLKVTNANWYFDDAAAFRRKPFPLELMNSLDLTSSTQQTTSTSASSTLSSPSSSSGLVYIKLPGDQRTIGTLVNGAGLAMNTVDNLRNKAANFLDTGGKATSETVKEAFKVILQDMRVKVIFVNIFGGLTKGDMIAEGVLKAFEELKLAEGSRRVPVVVRIKGTREEEARKVIEESGWGNMLVAVDEFEEGVERVLELSEVSMVDEGE
ncbi:succinyl-CoA synthetase-like protein [Cladorrhinum sp. PSN259]|nr:succinyl-CoA synthetase-like protein [Cladorrhinum sp. PSN259]